MRAALAFMQIDPHIVGVDLDIIDLEIVPSHGFLRLDLSGGTRVEGTARHLIGALHTLITHDLLREHPTDIVAHGATIVIDGKRFLLLADKGSGKTTLALHLLAAGHRIEGDEHLVIEPASVIARPRNLRVKAPSFDLVPGLPAAARDAPSIDLWDGAPLFAVSPAIAGRPWEIRRGPLDHLILLEPNHGGRSLARPIRPALAFERLLRNVYLPEGRIPLAAALLRRLTQSIPAHRLQIGDLSGAEWHLTRLARA